MAKYDFLIVGAGLFGSVFAYEAACAKKTCLVIDRRDAVGGNIRCETWDGINIHLYGAHIFHTKDAELWDYVNRFARFNHYVNSPIANYKGEIYNLPFNMNTFSRMWNVSTPSEARRIIQQQQQASGTEVPKNLEQQAIRLVGHDVYEKLIKGYTEKQWGRPCTELPPSIIKRLPVRYTYDNNYFNDPYQGIPIGGYNQIIDALLEKADVELGSDYHHNRDFWNKKASKVLYTGALDALFDYSLGKLQYRSIRLENRRLQTDNFQGVAVMNYTDRETPYTRIIEHKHFEFGTQDITWISYEYPCSYEETQEPYYPIGDEANVVLHQKYVQIAKQHANLLLGGRLAEYAYYDMDKTIASALKLARTVFEKD